MFKRIKKIGCILTLLVPLLVNANEEVDAICELNKAKAALSASILSSPFIYGSNNENSTAVLALGYSLSGRNKASLVKEIAEVKCTSAASTNSLEEQQKWILITVYKAGARAEVVTLIEARELAKKHLEFIDKQLAEKIATINEYNSSRQILISIENKISSLKAVLAEPSLPLNKINFKEVLDNAKISEGKIAELMAKQEAQNAWDITLAAGTQKDLADTTSKIAPFLGISFKWSFSNVGINESISTIRSKTENLYILNQSGHAKVLERLLEKINEMLNIERERETLLLDIIEDNKRIIKNFSNLESVVAITTRKTMEVQNLVYIAELSGIRARIDKYSGIKN